MTGPEEKPELSRVVDSVVKTVAAAIPPGPALVVDDTVEDAAMRRAAQAVVAVLVRQRGYVQRQIEIQGTQVRRLQQDLITTLAGPAATIPRRSVRRESLREDFFKALVDDNHREDVERATLIALQISPGNPEASGAHIAEALLEAEQLVRAHWTAVTTVASALVAKKKVSEQFIRRLVGSLT